MTTDKKFHLGSKLVIVKFNIRSASDNYFDLEGMLDFTRPYNTTYFDFDNVEFRNAVFTKIDRAVDDTEDDWFIFRDLDNNTVYRKSGYSGVTFVPLVTTQDSDYMKEVNYDDIYIDVIWFIEKLIMTLFMYRNDKRTDTKIYTTTQELAIYLIARYEFVYKCTLSGRSLYKATQADVYYSTVSLINSNIVLDNIYVGVRGSF